MSKDRLIALTQGNEVLISHISQPDSTFNSILEKAIENGSHPALVHHLITKCKADVNAKFPQGDTPLTLALKKGFRNIPKYLIDHGANLDAKDLGGFTLLQLAAAKGYTEIVQLLIDRGASIETSHPIMGTPLHSAAKSGRLEIAKLLVAHGADVMSKDANRPLSKLSPSVPSYEFQLSN